MENSIICKMSAYHVVASNGLTITKKIQVYKLRGNFYTHHNLFSLFFFFILDNDDGLAGLCLKDCFSPGRFGVNILAQGTLPRQQW